MLRVIVRQARPGMTLARAVTSPRQGEETLLPSGYTLNAQSIAGLHEAGIYDLWVHYPGLDFLDDLFTPELTTTQQRICEALKSTFHRQEQLVEGALPVQQYRSVVEDLAHAMLGAARTVPEMMKLGGEDDALLEHSVNVCVLGMMLGLRLENYLSEQRKRAAGRQIKDLVNLGLGCMLHDIGELQMPEILRETRHTFVGEEEGATSWRRHVELGYAAVRGQIEPTAATVVLNHHQHFDGSGFPNGPGGEVPQFGQQIHVFARIAMAADTFEHLLHADGMVQPTVKVLWQIQQKPWRRWFDPIVMTALLQAIPPFVPGMLVGLSDRRQGIVTKVYEDAPCYPEVQILNGMELMERENLRSDRETVNLAEESSLYIEAVDGFRVGDYLYGSRHAAHAVGA